MDVFVEVSLPLILGLFFYLLIDIVSEIISHFRRKVWTSNVENKELIQETIWFTNDILYQKKIRMFPVFTISYYKHKRFAGVYDGNKITIYIKNTFDVESIVRITLHETCHYIQHHTQEKEYAKYEFNSLKFGYDNNPLESECRQFADKWKEPCLKHLLSKNVVKLQ